MSRTRRARRVLKVAQEEAGGLDPRMTVGWALAALVPHGTGVRVRTRLLRSAGIEIGANTVVLGYVHVNGGRAGRRNLRIGKGCVINAGCRFDATAPIEIGDRVGLGFDVLMTTSQHDWAYPERRLGALLPDPIRIGDGAWIATRAVVLPGVTIGEGAVVAAGAVVTKSVAPHTMVGGVPARVIRAELPDP